MDFSMLDSANYKTKCMLASLIECVRSRVDIDLGSDRLFIEAFATGDEGCLLYISVVDGVPQVPQTRNTSSAIIITEFPDFNTLIDLGKNFQTLKALKSQLYYKSNLFRLVTEISKADRKNAIRLLSEYGTVISSDELPATKEYFECVEEEQALEKISQLQ